MKIYEVKQNCSWSSDGIFIDEMGYKTVGFYATRELAEKAVNNPNLNAPNIAKAGFKFIKEIEVEEE